MTRKLYILPGYLIEEARKAVNTQENPDKQARLAQVAKAGSQALNNCVNCLPGLRDVDGAVKHITRWVARLSYAVLSLSQLTRVTCLASQYHCDIS